MMTVDGNGITVVNLIILLATVNTVNSTYLISVSDDKKANQSESVTMSCKAYNNLTAQEFAVAWRRSGVVITERKIVNTDNLKQFISEDDLYRYIIHGLPVSSDVTDYKLEIKNLKKEDIDDYACSLCKRPRDTYSCIEPLQIAENLPVSLDVMYTPIKQYPECSILEKTSLGSEITVECVSEEGKPRVDLKFTIEGDILDSESTATSPSADGMLKITHSFTVTESNIGKEIGCNSTSPHFKEYSGSCANGIITDTPAISLTSTPAGSVSVGEPVSFTCFAKSRSEIKYFDWTTNPKCVKNRMKISTDLSSSISTMTLDETSSDDHQTRINCSVANEAGEIQTALNVLSIKEVSILPTAQLDTTKINLGSKTTGELENTDESSAGLIVGIILAVALLIVISGVAGYLLFVRRKTHKGHKPVPLNETSSTVDNAWNGDTGDQLDKCKTGTTDGLNECEQNKNAEFTEVTSEVQEYRDEDDFDTLAEDDVFMDVTHELPIPTHV